MLIKKILSREKTSEWIYFTVSEAHIQIPELNGYTAFGTITDKTGKTVYLVTYGWLAPLLNAGLAVYLVLASAYMGLGTQCAMKGYWERSGGNVVPWTWPLEVVKKFLNYGDKT